MAYLEKDGPDYYLTDLGSTTFHADFALDLAPDWFNWQNSVKQQTKCEFLDEPNSINDRGVLKRTNYPTIVRRKLSRDQSLWAKDLMDYGAACLLMDVYCRERKVI